VVKLENGMMNSPISRRTLLAGAAALTTALIAPRLSAASALSVTKTDGSFDRVKTAQRLSFGTSNDQPYCYIDPATGKIVGIDAEMMLAVLEKLGIANHDTTQVDFDGLIPSLLASRMDVIADAMYITEKRKKVINFSDGWYRYGEALLVQVGNPLAIHSLDDLKKGTKVGSYLGTVYLDWLAEIDGVKVSSYPDAASAMEDLRAGRLDAAIVDAPVAGFALARNEKYKNAFEMVSDYTPKEIGIIGAGFRKEDGALLEAFNWGLKAIKEDGTDLAILKKWGLSEQNRYLG
jgi:polar amino acid transport system substrate-binding protein